MEEGGQKATPLFGTDAHVGFDDHRIAHLMRRSFARLQIDDDVLPGGGEAGFQEDFFHSEILRKQFSLPGPCLRLSCVIS